MSIAIPFYEKSHMHIIPLPSSPQTSDESELDFIAGPEAVMQCGSLPYPPLTSFIGRQQEMAEVTRLLITTRLLTLTGTGGCGKTRLAFQVATALMEQFEQGVRWVELEVLADPLLVPQAVALALGVREQPNRPLMDSLVHSLRSQQLLLVLDNCEHVVAACAKLAQLLLPTCPNLRILTTSREALRIAGETTWLVPSLRLPDHSHLPPIQELMQYEAVQLFVERAVAVLPTFTLTPEHASTVVQICHRLDGIPLAIELAATWVKVLSIQQIIARLDDVCRLLTIGSRTALPRQRTLRATIDWSYGLLSKKEQAFFRRLSVFAGGFTLEAAEALCVGEDIVEDEVLVLLSHLVDKSLVMVQERDSQTRYRIIEVMRQYGQDQLQEAGEVADLRRRHRDWYLGVAEQAEQQLLGRQQAAWFNRLEAEHDNLRAALCWSLEKGQAETAAYIGGAIWQFWLVRGYLSEGRRWLEEALAGVSGCTAVRAKALHAAGSLANCQHDCARAKTLLEESLDVWRTLGNKEGRAYVLYTLGQLAHYRGDYAQASTCYEESLALLRELGNRWGMALVLAGFGLTVLCRGDHEQATMLCEESLSLAREWGEMRGVADSLTNLGMTVLERGNYVRASALCEESLAIQQQLGDKVGSAHTLTILGRVALGQGNNRQATTHYEESLTLYQEIGDKAGIATALEGLASVAGAQGQPLRAVRLYGAAEALRDTIDARLAPTARTAYEGMITMVRAQLDEAVFANAWTQGRGMTLEQGLASTSVERITLPKRAIHPATPQTPSTRVKVLPELRFFALGPVRVYRGKQALAPNDWTYAKARELLFYLLCHRSRTKEQIGLALWPDASAAQLRNSFHATLHHLRRALGRPEWILFERGRYTFNRQLAYWFDIETFEARIAQAHQLQARAPAQSIHLLQEAVKLYRGNFLEDLLEGDWYLLRQQEVRRMYRDALMILGQLLFNQERYAQAADAYRRLIAYDSLQEAAHRELMRCYAHQGERAQALRHYQDLVELMYNELGSLPAAETTALFEQLRHGEAS